MFRSSLLLLAVVALCAVSSTHGFVIPQGQVATKSTTAAYVFGKKKEEPEEDLSFIETRDMTREEMMRYNAASERVMNQELIGMTVFSLVISIPMFYLVWVGFFAETTEFGL